MTRDGQRFGVLWLIGDVDFKAVDRDEVGDTTLLRPTHPPELLVSRLLPGALWAHDYGHPSPGARHSGLLWASNGTGPPLGRHHVLNNGMGRFMQTLRLATAATSVKHMLWLGVDQDARGPLEGPRVRAHLRARSDAHPVRPVA